MYAFTVGIGVCLCCTHHSSSRLVLVVIHFILPLLSLLSTFPHTDCTPTNELRRHALRDNGNITKTTLLTLQLYLSSFPRNTFKPYYPLVDIFTKLNKQTVCNLTYFIIQAFTLFRPLVILPPRHHHHSEHCQRRHRASHRHKHHTSCSPSSSLPSTSHSTAPPGLWPPSLNQRHLQHR